MATLWSISGCLEERERCALLNRLAASNERTSNCTMARTGKSMNGFCTLVWIVGGSLRLVLWFIFL